MVVSSLYLCIEETSPVLTCEILCVLTDCDKQFCFIISLTENMAAHNEENYCESIYENNPAIMENADLDLQHVADVVQYYKSNIDNYK